jgi:hypothetical protein
MEVEVKAEPMGAKWLIQNGSAEPLRSQLDANRILSHSAR